MNTATASEKNDVDFFLEHLSLDQVSLNNGDLPSKPAPNMFLKASKSVSADLKNSAVFEDYVLRIQAVNRASAGKVVLGEDPKIDKMNIPTDLRIDTIASRL